MSKRKIANKLLSIPARLYKKKVIIFYSAANFHSAHLIPVITAILPSKKIKVILLGEFGEEIGVKVYKSHDELPLYLKYDIFISTDLTGIPHWMNPKKIFFGHGVGPKINYQSSDALKAFDVSFVPCQPFYAAHLEKVKVIHKVGLPILDNLKVNEAAIREKLGINADTKILLYAPSWNSNPSLISDIIKITDYLASAKGFQLVISPHPLLLVPKRCGGINFINSSCNWIINKPQSGISTLELCQISSAVVSDISSILFEALAINKKVFWDGNFNVYESCGATETLELVKRAAIEIDYSLSFSLNYTKESNNENLIDEYIYNRGVATKKFISSLEKETGINFIL